MSFLRHGKSIDPMWDWKTPGQELEPAPALIGLDEFRLAIPRRVGLHQGPPPLHQLGAACSKLGLPVEAFPSNGEVSLNWLSHPRGQAQYFPSKRYHPSAAANRSERSDSGHAECILLMANGTPQILFATGTTDTAQRRGWGGTAQTGGTIQSEKSKSKGEPQWRQTLLT